MKLCMLVTDEMKETMPTEVKTLQDFGRISVRFPKSTGGAYFINGSHAYLEAPTDVFVNWLKPFDGVAVGKGSPRMQEFEMMHIKE